MRQISSHETCLQKRVVAPIYLIGIVALVGFAVYRDLGPPVLLVSIGIIFCAGAFVVLKRTVWDNADVVIDAGDRLVVKRGGIEMGIPLTDIMAVRSNRWRNPEQIIIALEHSGPFGSEVAFLPSVRSWRFAVHPVVREIQTRVATARASRLPEATPGLPVTSIPGFGTSPPNG